MPTSRYTTSKKTRKMVSFAMLTAIIIALQIVCTFIKFGPFSITLALAPIIVGAAIYGVGAGAYLGAVMGLVIFVTGLMGLDGGAVMAMLSYGGWIGIVFTPIVCFGKSMAAGALAELFGLVIDKIEYAAEIAIEHHLGLTCDPICGLVQIPCIERNAVAAMRAMNAVSLAGFLSDSRKISFDLVIQTMYETGKDLSRLYRETSEGGLAKLYK